MVAELHQMELGLSASPQNTLLKEQRGTAMVEFSVAAPFFFVFVVATLELLRLSFNMLSLQFVVDDVMRQIVVSSPQVIANRGFASREEYIVETIIAEARSFGVSVQPEAVGMRATVGGVWVENTAGTPESLLAVDVQVPTSGFVWNNIAKLARQDFTLRVRVLGKNEPYGR